MTEKKMLNVTALSFIVLAVLALIVAFLKIAINIVLPAGASMQDPGWSSAAATWTGALGAFLAFTGTIWIATSERRRREQEERIKAEIVAASFLLPIHRLMATLTTVRAAASIVDQIKTEDYAVKAVNNLILEMQKLVVWKVEDLMPLRVLPDDLISRMVIVDSHNNLIHSYLVVMLTHIRGDAKADLLQIKSDLMDQLATALENVDVCRVLCRRHQRKLEIQTAS